MALITVCTPTYNRAHTLDRPFESLMQQTNKEFVWLVVDDGSTDETEALIKKFKDSADFPVIYVKQQNRGRAGALNTSFQYITTELVVNLDSDDAFVPNAIEKMYTAWNNMSQMDKKRVWCITGHCIDSNSKKIIGGIWPEDINELRGRKLRKTALKHKKGEKCCCRKVAVLKEHPFPTLEGTKFVPEDIVWTQIDKKYDQYYINEVFRIYYQDSPDSLCKGKTYGISYHVSCYYAYLNYLNTCFDEFFYNKAVRWSVLGICRQAIRIGRKHNNVCAELNTWYKRMMVSFVWLPIWFYSRHKP